MQTANLLAKICESQETKQWYVLRDLKRHNAKQPAWKTLPQKGFEVFTPMKQHIVTIKGERKCIERPVLPDLLFVYSDRRSLDAEIELTPTLQYRYLRGAPYQTPMTVHRSEMERFINAVRSVAEPQYYLPSELTTDMIGKKIRVVDGPLAGYEGTLLKVRGTRKRRLLVALENYIVAAIEIHKDFIEFI